ncbi:MAG: permease-like cell division protein FtsX [Acidimicrobiia bacterium]
MNLEKRLQSAANELNQSTRNSSPPPLRPASETMRPWMAFAAAFAVVLALFGIPYALTNFGDGGPSDSSPLAGAGSTTSTTECVVAETTTSVDSWPDNADVIAFLKDESSTSGLTHEELVAEVESWDEVSSVSYFDKNDAWVEYQQVFEGQDDLLDIDPAILPASIRIELTDIALQDEVQSRLEQLIPVVREVQTAPNDEEPSAASTDCVVPGDSTTEVATTMPGPVCAASELYPPTTLGYSDDNDGSDPRDLTEPVKDKLTRIAEAASRCDASALAALASDDITTTFGSDGGPEDIASWSGDDERFTIITELFNMTHGVTELDGGRLFVWPTAFAYDSWDEIPAAVMDELLRIYTREELDQISLLGSYGGWRIGITETGEWIFFVAGD